MTKIYKIANITLIFMLPWLFLFSNLTYSSDTFYLRPPMGQIPTGKTQDVVLTLVFDKLSKEKDIEDFIAALDEMGRKDMFDSYEFTKKFIEFYRELESSLRDTIGETLGKKIIEDSKSLANINVGDCWIIGEYYIIHPVPYQVLNLIILASDPRAIGGLIPNELNKEAVNSLHKIYNSLSREERFRLRTYLDGVASGIIPWVGPLKEQGAPGEYPLILSMRLQAAEQNVSISEGDNSILYPKLASGHLAENIEQKKDWDATERDYRILIEAASSEAELKRVYRKMAFEVHPDRNKGDEKNAEAVFKRLSKAIEQKLDKDFRITPADIYKERKGFRWMDLWASSDPFYEGENRAIMEEAVRKLKERAEKFTDEIKGIKGKDLVIEFLAKQAAHLSADEIDQLLDTPSKKLFSVLLMNKIQPKALAIGAISDEVIWKVRPLLERLYLARQLRIGEIVHIRIGDRIERAVILEPITEQNPRLKAITVGAPFQGLEALYGYPSRFIELSINEIVSLLIDFEREPKQTGYPINIGEIIEIDNGYDPIFRATVYAKFAKSYHAIQHKPHNNLEYYLGYGYDFSSYAGELALKDGRIKKVELALPRIKPRINIELPNRKAIDTGS